MVRIVRGRGSARRPRPRLLDSVVPSLVAAVVLLSACSGGSDRSPTGSAPEVPVTNAGDATLDWADCVGGECARLIVPLDHDEPDGRTLELALIRTSTADEDRRIGSLLLNPGGPGGSGVAMARYLRLPAEVTDRFDIVGFDPRGVGGSSPLDCHDGLEAMYDADPTMEDDADRRHFLEVSRRFVDLCEERHGDVLDHMGTVEVARDLDLIREALGDEQLNYLGFSYGTAIGQQYARLFPTRVRAMILDGVVDPAQGGLEGAFAQARAFEAALDRFIRRCDDRLCLGDDTEAVIDGVIASAEQRPIEAPGADRPATPGVVQLAITQGLYADWLETELTAALIDAAAGDGTALVALADDYLGRVGDDHPSGFEIYFAVSCLDSVWPRDPDDVFAAAKAAAGVAPRTGEALVNDYVRCALWPADPQPLEPIPGDVEGLAPILLVSTTGDPATPHETAVSLVEKIPGARLLTHEGDGHTVVASGDGCVDGLVGRYLIEARVPEADLLC